MDDMDGVSRTAYILEEVGAPGRVYVEVAARQQLRAKLRRPRDYPLAHECRWVDVKEAHARREVRGLRRATSVRTVKVAAAAIRVTAAPHIAANVAIHAAIR